MSDTYRKGCPRDWGDKPYKSDHKPYCKPNSKFKKLQKQRRKAKEKQALKVNPDNIPIFKKTDEWDWL